MVEIEVDKNVDKLRTEVTKDVDGVEEDRGDELIKT